jgi:ABC-type Zn uptake system ZnuABC Zn-binding protein ZnuA
MKRVLAACVVCVTLLSACGGAGGTTATTAAPVTAPVAKKSVVVTNSILGDFVSVIAAGQVNVTVLAPQNLDPRTYVLTPDDITKVTNADLLIENGLGLEPWFDTFVKTADLKGPVVKAANGITTRNDENGGVDPFIWVSPSNGRVMVANVSDALSSLLPDLKGNFQASERAYTANLDNTIAYERNVMSPVASNKLVYVGEPLGYFCDEFVLNCTAVSAVDVVKKSAPSNVQINKLVNGAKAVSNPAAIVISKDVPLAIVDNVKSAQPNARVVSGEDGLSVESVGDASTRHSDYLSLQRDIADTLSAQLR